MDTIKPMMFFNAGWMRWYDVRVGDTSKGGGACVPGPGCAFEI
jgi:hypothetical protein